MGSAYVGALFAHAAFWGMLVYGRIVGRLSPAQMMGMLGLWIAGFVGLPWVKYLPARAMFPSYVAVLDIVLVLMIAGGDVRISRGRSAKAFALHRGRRSAKAFALLR